VGRIFLLSFILIVLTSCKSTAYLTETSTEVGDEGLLVVVNEAYWEATNNVYLQTLSRAANGNVFFGKDGKITGSLSGKEFPAFASENGNVTNGHFVNVFYFADESVKAQYSLEQIERDYGPVSDAVPGIFPYTFKGTDREVKIGEHAVERRVFKYKRGSVVLELPHKYISHYHALATFLEKKKSLANVK